MRKPTTIKAWVSGTLWSSEATVEVLFLPLDLKIRIVPVQLRIVYMVVVAAQVL